MHTNPGNLLSSSYLALILAAALFPSGNRVNPLDLEIRVLDSIPNGTTVEIDVVAVTESEYARHFAKPVSHYFDSNENDRKFFEELRLPKTSFIGDTKRVRAYPASEHKETWDGWIRAGKTHLVVIANLIGIADHPERELDPRELKIALSRKELKSGTRTILIHVGSAGLREEPDRRTLKQIEAERKRQQEAVEAERKRQEEAERRQQASSDRKNRER
jgi:hypothetical protein